MIERLHMISQHSNNLATATTAILVHNENLCTKMAAVSMAKGCMQMLRVDRLQNFIERENLGFPRLLPPKKENPKEFTKCTATKVQSIQTTVLSGL